MKDYKKYATINCLPEELYKSLTIPETIELWTGSSAIMSTEPDSEFELWDGQIVGKNLEFIENKMIKQQWYFDGQQEASIVTIKLHTIGQETSMEIRHTNIPDEAYEDMVEGWEDVYIASLLDFYS